MECKCGGSTNYTEHEVKTMDVANEWYEGIKLSDLPITIMKYKCSSCGRIHVKDRKS